MSINVRCPHCRQKAVVPGRSAGRVIPCHGCGGAFQVPNAPPPPPPPPREPERRRRRRRMFGSTFATKVAVWVCVVLWTGYQANMLLGVLASKGVSAVQEGAAGSVVAALVVCGYVAARAIDALVEANDRWARRDD